MFARYILKIYVYILSIIMVAPLLAMIPISITTTTHIAFPPVGVTFHWYLACFREKILTEALTRSLILAGLSAGISVVIALMASFAIERHDFPGKRVIEAFCTGPQIVPQIILVLSLLMFYHSIHIANTFFGLLVSHILITFPFTFRTILSGVASSDVLLEWSAKVLGANWWTVLRQAIIPQIKMPMIFSFIFAFVVSFNNVTMALFLSSPGQRTLPVELFVRTLVTGVSPKEASLSVALAVFGLLLFFVLDKVVGVYGYLTGGNQE